MIRAWCPSCDEDVLPRDDGSCRFCDADTDLHEQRRSVALAALCASSVAVNTTATVEVAW